MFVFIARYIQPITGFICIAAIVILLIVTWDMNPPRVALTPAEMQAGINVCETADLHVVHNGRWNTPASKIWCSP